MTDSLAGAALTTNGGKPSVRPDDKISPAIDSGRNLAKAEAGGVEGGVVDKKAGTSSEIFVSCLAAITEETVSVPSDERFDNLDVEGTADIDVLQGACGSSTGIDDLRRCRGVCIQFCEARVFFSAGVVA